MKFDRSRVYSAVNAEELKPGDKVIVADDLVTLKAKVSEGFDWYVVAITSILGEEWYGRFDIDKYNYTLAYLVERAEPKTEKKAEKHYRPFRDTDELIKTWIAKRMITYPDLCLPHIWVCYKDKHIPQKGTLIRTFFEEAVSVDEKYLSLETLFKDYEFLDGSPCGVEE